MQHHTNRLRWAVLPVALRVVGVVTLCIAILSFMAFHPASRANATGHSRRITGTISSSPSSGPVGTAVTVNGSGWGGTDGTPVSFGYEVGSSCQIVADSQNGSLSGGSFSGWFRWPSGTALNTYRVCALLGNVMEVAGSFSVLSSSPPSVSISPSPLAPNTQATIIASNYYPAGTQVDFLWMSGNTVIENLNSVTSGTSGIASLTFTVPDFSIASGQYSINATTGSQPPTLFSSTNFTYNAPTVSPSPTPRPSPSPTPSPMPSPTMTPGVTPTTTPATTPTATASVTATTATPAVGASPTVGNNQTPTTNSTNTGNTNNSNTSTPTSSSSSGSGALLVGGVFILFGALLAAVAAVLLVRRRRKAASAATQAMPPGLPPSPAQAPWANAQNLPGTFMNNGAMAPPLNNNLSMNGSLPGGSNPLSYPAYNPNAGPGIFTPQPGNMPVRPVPPAPVPVGAGASAGNGNTMAFAGNAGTMPPAPPSPQPPAWLVATTANGNAPATGVNMPPTAVITADPALDAMRRQLQSGLFVTPRPFKDERSQ